MRPRAYGNDTQQQRWLGPLVRGEAIGCFALTEPEAGSDVASLRTTAQQQADGSYLATGQKWWITNGGRADVMILFATVEDLGTRSQRPHRIPGRHQPARPRPHADARHRARPPRGSDHATLTFGSFLIAADEVLGAVGKGFGVAMGGLAAGRLSVAAGAVGIHRAALAATVEFTTGRQQFGQSLASFQMVQERLADMLTTLHASRAASCTAAPRAAPPAPRPMPTSR